MYARLTTFTFRIGTRTQAEELASRFVQLLSEQPGYRHSTFYFVEGQDQFGSFSVWDTREHAVAVTPNVRAAAQITFGEVLEGTWATKIVEVFHDSQAQG